MARNAAATLRLSVLFAVLSGISALSSGQTPGTTYGEMQSTLAAAQAGANRTGDESLSCESLESELVTTAKHPAVQSYTQGALTLFSSVVPGGAWAGHAVGVAQAQAQQAQAASNIEQRMQQAQEMMGIMPQLMRGQRILELAQARNCAWVREGMSR
jgi:hypothetical protein